MATLIEDLKDLVDLLPADQSAELRKIIENPSNAKFAQELKDGRLRQSDYSKLMNDNKGKLKYADDMKTWADQNIPKHEQLLKDFTELETTKNTLERQANDLRDQLTKVKAGELDVDEATLNARVEARTKELGYVNRSELDTIVKQEAQKLAREESALAVKDATSKFLTETWPAAQAINSAIIMKSFAHMKEFGDPLNDADLEGISNLMKERNIMDPRKAYDEWITPKRQEKQVAAEVERRVNEEVSKRAGFPGVTGVPVSELGPMQAKAAGTLPELPDGDLGSGSAAMAAAKELRAEAKF